MTRIPSATDSVTCLGCGCACDDIDVTANDGRIVDLRNACELGVRWFGDGAVPSRILVTGADAPLEAALAAAADSLGSARMPLVYLAPGLSCESQRRGVAIADVLRARLETPTSEAANFVLAAQERGFASATFGEIRHRADVVVYWGVDIAGRYPRFVSRYVPPSGGMHVTQRQVIAVDVGSTVSSVDADIRVTVDPASELAILTALQSLSQGSAFNILALPELAEIWSAIEHGRYVALVFDAEPAGQPERSRARVDALVALSQALNARTRCAGIALRAGGNRSGADSVLVAQTGYPFAADFARGFPRYDPYGSAAFEPDVALVAGDAALLSAEAQSLLRNARCVVVGPSASDLTLGAASICIDTGRDGIHAAGTAVRADDVPLPLRAPLLSDRKTVDVLASLTPLIRRHR